MVKYWGLFIDILAVIGGLSTILIIIRLVAGNFYRSKLKPLLILILPGLKKLDEITDALVKADKENKIFKTLDEIIDYILKELEEAGIKATEEQVIEKLKTDGVTLKRENEGWRIDLKKSL